MSMFKTIKWGTYEKKCVKNEKGNCVLYYIILQSFIFCVKFIIDHVSVTSIADLL